MSRSRQGNGPEAQQITPIENDARVEILLFLGIIFWCWLLFSYFQGGIAGHPESSIALQWNGSALQVSSNQLPILGQGEGLKAAPAVVAPLLFQPIPVNFADGELLATISGIGPELAAQIIKTRDARGLFSGPQDLLAVPGIGPARMKQFAPQLSFSVIQ